jgi:deoxyribodipyrimidine photo-lyase
MLERFLHTKSRASQLGPVDPLEEGAQSSASASRALTYKDKRDRADMDTTSRLRCHHIILEWVRWTDSDPISPYLSAGVISCREVVRAAMDLLGRKRVESSRDTSVGMWVQELGTQETSTRSYSFRTDVYMINSMEGLLYPCHVRLAACVDGQTVPGKVRKHQMGSK